MNYANMIEEKGLKKTFIIATLVSTLVGTFAASHNLYERLSQKKKDAGQDDAIKKLEAKIDEMKKTGGGEREKSEELRHSLDTSGLLIRREYDLGYDRLGRRFAIGDLITENELQRQVITLQQTVIRVLEDAMYNNRYIDPAGLDQLVWASQTARNGSLDALKGQYQRLLLQAPPHPALQIRTRPRSPPPPEPPRRPPPLLLPPPPEASGSSSHRHKGKKPDVQGIDFFCRYSLDLQRTSSLPLSRTFDPSPKGPPKTHCPVCRVFVDADASDMWEIDIPSLVRDKAKEVRHQNNRNDEEEEGRWRDSGRGRSRSKSRGRNRHRDEVVAMTTTSTTRQRKEIKRFRVPARFVVKCHTRAGDYSCVLCCGPQNGYRGEVVLCDDPEALVDHVAREHRIGDIENEWDILAG